MFHLTYVQYMQTNYVCHNVKHAQHKLKLVIVYRSLKHTQQELKKKTDEIKSSGDGYKKDQASYDLVKKAMDKLEVHVFSLIF